MSDTTRPAVNIAIRIPGSWRNPEEMFERIPQGYRITEDRLILPDQTAMEIFLMPPDEEFAAVFRSTLRRPAAPEEMAKVNRYTVNVGLRGPGGSIESARQMMRAGAAIIQAGGAGVFIDNSVLSHGGQSWLDLANEGDPEAVSFAFVGIIRGSQDVWTVGMQVPGFPDIVMKRADADANDRAIIEMLRYVCEGESPVGDGHIVADEAGPRFVIQHEVAEASGVPTPMRNPWGRLRMISVQDIAERN